MALGVANAYQARWDKWQDQRVHLDADLLEAETLAPRNSMRNSSPYFCPRKGPVSGHHLVPAKYETRMLTSTGEKFTNGYAVNGRR